MQHRGNCHCGSIQFEFDAPADVTVHRCNCSLCDRVGYLHLIIPKASFSLLVPWEKLSLYTFNTGIAQHYFCPVCGVKPFYIPRSNPDGFSINCRCVEPATFGQVTIEDFDGKNWEQNAGSLAHLSRPG